MNSSIVELRYSSFGLAYDEWVCQPWWSEGKVFASRGAELINPFILSRCARQKYFLSDDRAISLEIYHSVHVIGRQKVSLGQQLSVEEEG